MQHSPLEIEPAPPSLEEIGEMWWPLALSWLLMSVEGPAHSAIVARLSNPEINLAAWGGIVFPLALIIESPVVMLLSASTALSRDWKTYLRLRKIAMTLGALLTGVHIAVAFTPLYDIVVRHLIQAPEATIEPGRLGLMIMTPWSWAIAYRRFQQGAMIRFGRTRAVGVGTMIRMTANGLVLLGGYLLKRMPGIVVASSAVATGVIAEAVYAGLRIRPILRHQIRVAPDEDEPLTLRGFVDFYVPLALTSLITFFVSPIGSAAMSRMPAALSSLAAWPVINGLIFMLRSPGLAYNETVVALLDRHQAFRRLRRFAAILGAGSCLLIFLVVATPLSRIWLTDVMALPPDLVTMGRRALWLGLPLPALALIQSWYQGIIVHSGGRQNRKRTRGITESVAIYLVITTAILGIGVALQRIGGLLVAIIAMGIAGLVQVGWLWYRSRPAVAALNDATSA